jgi:hypothetical protein
MCESKSPFVARRMREGKRRRFACRGTRGGRWRWSSGEEISSLDASDANLRAARRKVLLRVVDGELIDEDGALCCGKRLA